MSRTLTDEQVRDAVMSADRWEKPMGDTGLTNTHLIIRDDGWQAIADELNATLGGGDKSRWFEMFGTPERAARTLEAIPCGNSPCSECPIFKPCLRMASTEPNALLEWLRGDA